LEFLSSDARRLEGCDTDSFDVVWFSFNGIDYSLKDDRRRIMAEVRRVLKTGERFVFSSHNLRARPWRPRRQPRLVFDRDPRQFVRRNLTIIRKHLTSHYYYRRNRRCELHGDGYALPVDQAHEYRLLTYHVSLRYQVDQLAAWGFYDIEVFGADGTPRGQGEDPPDAWLHYLARKSGASPDTPQQRV
jgi:SAM-dependent methyltransferase